MALYSVTRCAAKRLEIFFRPPRDIGKGNAVPSRCGSDKHAIVFPNGVAFSLFILFLFSPGQTGDLAEFITRGEFVHVPHNYTVCRRRRRRRRTR